MMLHINKIIELMLLHYYLLPNLTQSYLFLRME